MNVLFFAGIGGCDDNSKKDSESKGFFNCILDF